VLFLPFLSAVDGQPPREAATRRVRRYRRPRRISHGPTDAAAEREALHPLQQGRAWAAALLTRAEHGTLPGTAAEAVGLVEYDLCEANATTAWTTSTLRAAAGLARRSGGDPRQMAAALVAVGVTKPRHETLPPGASLLARCSPCTKALPTPAPTGRPNRWCSPACRQAAHRRRITETKPRNETSCPACGRPVAVAATGRPARWCSPACRTRAWRTQLSNENDPGHVVSGQ
jgi:hypothetical protein